MNNIQYYHEIEGKINQKGTFCIVLPDDFIETVIKSLIPSTLAGCLSASLTNMPIKIDIGRSRIHPKDYNETFNKKLGRELSYKDIREKYVVITEFIWNNATNKLYMILKNDDYKLIITIKNKSAHVIFIGENNG